MCFGFISLVGAYDFYNNNHVPYMLEQLKTSAAVEQCQGENDGNSLRQQDLS